MGRNSVKNWLAVGIILLFVGVTIAPTIAQNTEKSQSTSRGNWLYVGGGGPGNYTKIQDAIDNASNNDTVFVYKGLYNDYYPSGQFGYTVLLNKSITLIGEDKNDTIINGTGFAIVVKVAAHNVEITGFTIQNGGGDFCGGIRIMDNYAGTYIRNNILKNNNVGVFMLFNQKIEIGYNIIKNNGNGIYCFDGIECTVCHNIISDNTNGLVYVYGFTNMKIYNNEIRNNTIGIEAENNLLYIASNNFIHNAKHTKLSKGVYVSSINLLHRMGNIFLQNYWDNWKTRLPKPNVGFAVIAIQSLHGDIPIFIFPYFDIDLNPKKEPNSVF